MNLENFNPTDPSFYRHSHDWYPALLEKGLYQHTAASVPSYSMFRWEDVEPALKDWQTFSNLPPPGYEVFMGGETEFVGLMDPPAQSRLRALMGKAFSPAWIKTLETEMHVIAEEVVDEAIEREEVDFFGDVTKQFVGRLITHMHGLPRDNLDYYFEASVKIVGAFGFNSYLPSDHPLVAQKAATAMQANSDFIRHIGAYIEERRKNPGDDIISRLLSVEALGQRLTDKEVTTMARDLNLGALDTTACTAAAFALRLQHNPEQLQLLRDQPELVGTACEEALRLDGAARQAFRRTTCPVEIHGKTIPTGAEVSLWLSAANVDPAVNPDPLRTNFTRENRRLLTFATGPHTCPGARLARTEMRVLWSTLLAKTSSIEVDESSIEWYPSPHVHGPVKIKVRVKGR